MRCNTDRCLRFGFCVSVRWVWKLCYRPIYSLTSAPCTFNITGAPRDSAVCSAHKFLPPLVRAPKFQDAESVTHHRLKHEQGGGGLLSRFFKSIMSLAMFLVIAGVTATVKADTITIVGSEDRKSTRLNSSHT